MKPEKIFLRVLHVISSVNPAGGGPIEGLKQLAAVNSRAGHRIEVACLDAPGDPWVAACPVPCHALGPSFTSYGYTPRLVPWLRAHAPEFDAVVVNGLWQFGGLAAQQALAGTATPYFVYTHGMLDPWFKRTYPLKHAKKWLYWPWGDYRVLRDARAVLFTCEDERLLARQSFWLYRANERVVKYGTPGPGALDAAQQAAQKAAFLRRFPHLAGQRCLLFLGRVHVKKGPDLLFRAFARLLAAAPDAQRESLHLVMAGPADGAYGAAMQVLAAQAGLQTHITWTGMLGGDEKWGAFRAADAFVLPSHQENFGIAVAESLACGVPVLISNQVNIWREIVADGAGYVAPDTEAGTLDLLQRWLQTPPNEWAAMRTRAQACFAQRFHIEAAAQSLVDTLLDCGVVPQIGTPS